MFIRTAFGRLEVAKHPERSGHRRMTIHKNARLTFARRLQMVQDMTQRGLDPCEAVWLHGVTPPVARKWPGCYLSDERKESAVQFLRDAVAYYNRLGVTIKRRLTTAPLQLAPPAPRHRTRRADVTASYAQKQRLDGSQAAPARRLPTAAPVCGPTSRATFEILPPFLNPMREASRYGVPRASTCPGSRLDLQPGQRPGCAAAFANN